MSAVVLPLLAPSWQRWRGTMLADEGTRSQTKLTRSQTKLTRSQTKL